MNQYAMAEKAYSLYVTIMRQRGSRVSRPWQALLQDEVDDWISFVCAEKPYHLKVPADIAVQIRNGLE